MQICTEIVDQCFLKKICALQTNASIPQSIDYIRFVQKQLRILNHQLQNGASLLTKKIYQSKQQQKIR